MIIEDQAFLPAYEWFALHSPPSPPPVIAAWHSFSVFLCVAGQAYWGDMGEGVGEEPNHITAKKPGPRSVFSVK